MLEVIMIALAIILRVSIIWFMYNNFMELHKIKKCVLSIIYAAGFVLYGVYTFGLHISQDVSNPFRMLALLGLSVMLGTMYTYIKNMGNK